MITRSRVNHFGGFGGICCLQISRFKTSQVQGSALVGRFAWKACSPYFYLCIPLDFPSCVCIFLYAHMQVGDACAHWICRSDIKIVWHYLRNYVEFLVLGRYNLSLVFPLSCSCMAVHFSRCFGPCGRTTHGKQCCFHPCCKCVVHLITRGSTHLILLQEVRSLPTLKQYSHALLSAIPCFCRVMQPSPSN